MTQVTIGMPVYNGAGTIRAALDSLLAQSFGDFVIIISDNGSTDETEAICRDYQQRDARIHYVRQPANLGPAMNFRFVLFEARTPYFMWAAADDLWAPSFVGTHVAVLEQDKRAVCSQSKVLFTLGGVPSQMSEGTYPLPHDAPRNIALFLANPADNSRYYGLFRTHVLQSVFPTRNFYGVDWAVAAATLRFGTHVEVPDILMIRDTSDATSYERSVARDHRFLLWRIFPMLFMTRWLLTGGKVPLSAATLYQLARLNLHIGLRFGMYRLGRLAETRSIVQAVVRPGLRERMVAARRSFMAACYAHAHRMWRTMPLRLEQRQNLKRHVFRLLGRRAAIIPAYRGWTAVPATDRAQHGLPMRGWKLPHAQAASAAASVIIVVRNDLLATLGLIDSLVRTSGDLPLPIIVVDNGSTDVTCFLDAMCSGIVCHRLSQATSYGEAAMRGAGLAVSDNLIFLDQHVVVGPDFVPRILSALDKADMAGPQVRNFDGSVRSTGGRSPFDPEFTYAREVEFCPSAFAIRRSSLDRVGGVSPRSADFAAASSDIAHRLNAQGGRVLYWPAAVVTDTTDEPEVSASDHRIAPNAARRLLYIDAETPMPDRNAGSFEAVNLMRLFGEFGFLVTFLPESNLAHHGRYTESLQASGIHAVYEPYVSSVRDLLQRIGSELDMVVVCRAPIAAAYLDMIRELAPRARVVFNTIDLHGLRLMREAEVANDPRLMTEAKAAWASELASIAKADATIVVSTYEKELLNRELPNANVHVVPLVREIPERLDVPGFSERRDMMFVGTYQHPPNRDAVLYFAREIWPGIRRNLPDAKFLVVGSSITEDVQALDGNGIEVLGFVEDLDPLLASCRLTLAPLRFGAGLKGKVATSLQAGVPMVASSIAVEGTTLTHGTDILVADEPEEFVAAVVRLYTDGALWQRLSAAGFEFVRREYSIASSVPRLRKLLQSIGQVSETATRPTEVATAGQPHQSF